MAKLRHIAIAAKDPDAMAEFYKKAFEFKEVRKTDGPLAYGYHLSDGTIDLAILRFKTDQIGKGLDYTGLHHFGILVEDVEKYSKKVEALGGELRRLLGRSLRLRQVSAGGCNGCEVEANALGNIVFDAGRFGIEFVASPRHADGILITGPVTENMRQALLITYEAVADPRLVIAAGACAISGGLFRGNAEVANGIEDLLRVDLCIPGCPPHPLTRRCWRRSGSPGARRHKPRRRRAAYRARRRRSHCGRAPGSAGRSRAAAGGGRRN